MTTTPITLASVLPGLDSAAEFTNKHLAHIPRRGISNGNMAQHCIRVAKAMAEAGYKEHVVIAAMLHDVLEDAPVAPYQIQEHFGKEVLCLVLAVTKDKRKRGAKGDREHLQAAELAGPDAVAIKVADNTDNLATPQDIKDPKRYLRYSKAIQEMGIRALGSNHRLVLSHLRALRVAQLTFPSNML